MKKIVFTLILAVSALASWAYDFSAVSPSGQTLYYNISGSTVSVTYPGPSPYYWYGYSMPGDLVIPSSVNNGGTTYSVTSIGSSAFSGCSGLTSVSIPNSVTYIPNSTFSNCSGLTSVTIGTSVTYIGQGAFRDCSGLTSVIIPNSVARIDHLAFYGCDSILEITALPTISPSLGMDVFTCSRSTIVNIPCGCMMNYSVDWDYFTNFVEGMVFSVSVESGDTAQGSVAVLSQPTTCEDPQAVVSATPAPGYHFHHWSDGSTSNPYTFTVVSDTLLIAYFALDSTEGIDSVQPSDYSISTSGNQVVITGTSNQRVRIFDSMGRLLSTFRTSNSSTALPVLTTGVYLVQVANHPAQKVVIR
ncbi:MAG: leucine-rich repeat domain-containing protein [Bacteroidales bacterium]|nr:leucine-rich repeat domain-containing protein [Bacteroidales bacterium]